MTLKYGQIRDKVIDGHRAIIVQANEGLNLGTVLVVPLTDAKKWGGPRHWVHVCDSERNRGLEKDSAALVPLVEWVDRKILVKRKVLGDLHPDDLTQVKAKLRLVFGLLLDD